MITNQTGCGIWEDRETVEEKLQAANGVTIATALLKQKTTPVEKLKVKKKGLASLMRRWK